MNKKFGESSTSFSGDNNFLHRVEEFDGATDINVEIFGEGYHDYEFVVYDYGETVRIRISHENMTFDIIGNKK